MPSPAVLWNVLFVLAVAGIVSVSCTFTIKFESDGKTVIVSLELVEMDEGQVASVVGGQSIIRLARVVSIKPPDAKFEFKAEEIIVIKVAKKEQRCQDALINEANGYQFLKKYSTAGQIVGIARMEGYFTTDDLHNDPYWSRNEQRPNNIFHLILLQRLGMDFHTFRLQYPAIQEFLDLQDQNRAEGKPSNTGHIPTVDADFEKIAMHVYTQIEKTMVALRNLKGPDGKGLIHGDIKGENILLSLVEDGGNQDPFVIVYLSDFGLSVFYGSIIKTAAGDPTFWSWSVMHYNHRATFNSDKESLILATRFVICWNLPWDATLRALRANKCRDQHQAWVNVGNAKLKIFQATVPFRLDVFKLSDAMKSNLEAALREVRINGAVEVQEEQARASAEYQKAVEMQFSNTSSASASETDKEGEQKPLLGTQSENDRNCACVIL